MKYLINFLLFCSYNLSAQSGIIWEAPVTVTDGLTGHYHPRIVLDADENAVVIWGNDEDSYLARQVGMYFAPPMQLDPPEMSIFSASWAGPDIAAKGDTMYVVFKENPEDIAPIYCLSSYNGGVTFSAPVIVDGMIGDNVSRFPSVTVDEDGNPIIAFMKLDSDFLNPQYVVATSDDYGITFNMDVIASSYSGGEVCDCCPAGIAANENYIATLFRDNLDYLRNNWAGISTNNGISFDNGIQIDQTNWTIPACPASGPDGVINNDTLYSVFMSAGEGSSRVYFSTSSLIENTDEPDKRLTEEFEGLSIQNYPRIANFGNAIAIVWKQNANTTSEIPLLFTDNISNGFPTNYDTVAYLDFYGLENADVAVSSTKVHIVWQDNYTDAVMYREGIYFQPVTVQEHELENTIQVFPNPASTEINIESKIGLSSVCIYDIQNRIVKNVLFNGNKTANISLNEIIAGLYLIEMIDINGVKKTGKIVIK